MTQTAPAPPAIQDAATSRDASWVFFNGAYARYADAKVGLLTHGLNYGTGIFEGIRAYWSERQQRLNVFRMREHFERMERNAKLLHMRLPLPVTELIRRLADETRERRLA